MRNRYKHHFCALLISVGFFLINFAVINDYSINWDFHYTFFAGLYHLKLPVKAELVKYLPFVDPDPRRMVEIPLGPLQGIIPVFTYDLFYEKWKLFPFDSAFNLPTVIWGSIGLFVIYIFTASLQGKPAGFAALLFLATFPRYFGDIHTNFKDIPVAVTIAISIFYAWKIINRRHLTDILLGAFFFGLAFNMKVNAIFIPAVVFVWLVFLIVFRATGNLKLPFNRINRRFLLRLGIYFIASALSAYGVWALFWHDPYAHLGYLFWFFRHNTVNLEVLLQGVWYCSGVNVPWYYPFWYLAIVTPLPVLFFFGVGLVRQLKNAVINRSPGAGLMLIWFIVPISRFMLPQAAVLDGIRHFEEVVFPYLSIAATGLTAVTSILFKIKKNALPRLNMDFLKFSGAGLLFMYLGWNIISYHPYQLVYFNEMVGGVGGAWGKYDIDYWGISQKEAVLWVNKHAPPDSKIHIAMTGDTMGKYLRQDLLPNLNRFGYEQSDYVIVLNRQSFLYRYYFLWKYILDNKPVHTVKVHNTPLTWIYDNHPARKAKQNKWWVFEDPCIRKYWQNSDYP